MTDYAEGELFQILEDDGNLPEEQVTAAEELDWRNRRPNREILQSEKNTVIAV